MEQGLKLFLVSKRTRVEALLTTSPAVLLQEEHKCLRAPFLSPANGGSTICSKGVFMRMNCEDVRV